MSITKLQVGLASAFAVAGATGFVVQADTTAALRNEVAMLQQQSQDIAGLQAENVQLARTAGEIAELRRDDAKLAQLRDEAVALKSQMQALAAKAARPAASSAPAPRVVLNGPVFDISKLDQSPKAKFQARPSYPSEMRSTGTGGEVVVDFVVDDKGEVQNAFALRSSQREFESSAVEAVSRWKFQPGEKSGLPVNTHMQVPIVFTVNTATGGAGMSWETKKADVSAPWF